ARQQPRIFQFGRSGCRDSARRGGDYRWIVPHCSWSFAAPWGLSLTSLALVRLLLFACSCSFALVRLRSCSFALVRLLLFVCSCSFALGAFRARSNGERVRPKCATNRVLS